MYLMQVLVGKIKGHDPINVACKFDGILKAVCNKQMNLFRVGQFIIYEIMGKKKGKKLFTNAECPDHKIIFRLLKCSVCTE